MSKSGAFEFHYLVESGHFILIVAKRTYEDIHFKISNSMQGNPEREVVFTNQMVNIGKILDG